MLIRLAGHELLLDPSGALLWPDRGLLVVADLHLEKARSLARRGAFLPPHDTVMTLDRLEAVLARYRPETVVSLGDGFHDPWSARELDGPLFDRLAGLVRARRWLWVTGNHDPHIPLGLGGAVLPDLVLDGLALRHAPALRLGAEGELAGHLHPKARLAARLKTVVRPCFVGDGRRLLLPAFGALTGGLDALDPAIAGLFPDGFTAWFTGERAVHAVPHRALCPEASPDRHPM